MTRYAYSYRWQLIGLALIALLALILSSLAQAPSLPGSAAQQRSAAGVDGANAVVAATLADAHPADRTFFTAGYTVDRDASGRAYLFAGVHPADRTFFTTSYAVGIDSQAGAHPADRKFFTTFYPAGIDPLAHVHPADRKFFPNRYLWTAPSRAEDAGSD